MRIVNDALLNEADYEKFGAVKSMLAMFNSHERAAYRGDTVAHSILVDLKEAIYSGVLTGPQLEAIELYFVRGHTQQDVSLMLGISRQSVQGRVNSAVRNIQKVLNSGELYR